MSKITGLGARLFVGGYDLSGDVTALDEIAGSLEELECTGIDKSARERVGGLRDGVINATTWFNPSAGAAHDRFSDLPTSDQHVMFLAGSAIGDQAACMVSKQLNYAPSREDDGSLTAEVESSGSGYGLEWADLLTAGIRTDTTATNGTGLDYTATPGSTAFGLQAYLQVLAFAGTSVTVTIQDSADGSSWANVSGGAFTAATGITAERIAVTGTVRRHLRAITSGTFTSAQFVVAVVKNLSATAF